MPSALAFSQLDKKEDVPAFRAKELSTLKEKIYEIESRMFDIHDDIRHLDEKIKLNTEFLSTLANLGKFTSHFRDREVAGPVRDLEERERNIYKELVVVVANNKHSASNQIRKELLNEHDMLVPRLEELRERRNHLQEKLDDISTRDSA